MKQRSETSRGCASSTGTEPEHCGGVWGPSLRPIRLWKKLRPKPKSAAEMAARLENCGGNHGRSGIICREDEAASGHCPHRGRIRSPEEERAELYRLMPVSFREDPVVCCAFDKTDLSLLWVWGGRRRVQFRDRDGEMRLPGSGSHRR